MRKNSLTLFAVCATLLWAGVAAAQPAFPTPPKGGLPVCEANLAQAQALLSTCQTRWLRAPGLHGYCAQAQGLLSPCQTDLTACQNQSKVAFPGDGYSNPDAYGVSGHGPALSYTENGNGTFTDNSTMLMWEEKKSSPSGDVHDVNNTYTWSSSSPAANGTAFTVFLNTLNNTCDGDERTACTTNAQCSGIGNGLCGFAGHRDWRLPNVKELQSLVDYTQSNPAISSSVPGATQSGFYWSATTDAGDPRVAWFVSFYDGLVDNVDAKIGSNCVRAVRSGL